MPLAARAHPAAPAVFNWSGGKDSAMALHAVLREGRLEVRTLLTTLDEAHRRVSMHGLREVLLDLQAATMGLPLRKVFTPSAPSNAAYERRMRTHLEALRGEGVTTVVFGDIHLADLRAYREARLAEAGFTVEFPLWGLDGAELLRDFVAAGFKAVVVCVDAAALDRSFLGRELDETFFRDLPPGVDPCGENGEYHSFVYDGPLFHAPVRFTKGESVLRRFDGSAHPGFWYLDLLPDEA